MGRRDDELVLMLFALVFTEAYPDFVRGKARGDDPSAVVFFEWIAPFAVACGVIGVGLLVVGAVVSGLRLPDRPSSAADSVRA